MATTIQAFQIFLVLLVLPCITATVTKLWVVYDTKNEKFQVQEQPQTDYVAVASLANTINQTG